MLTELGYEVLLIGRLTSISKPLPQRTYQTHRMSLPFEKGPLFYAVYNIGLFLNLIFRKTNLLFSNDLDTLLPNYLVSKIKSTSLVYDSHEYFTEVPELINRPRVQSVWKSLESWMLPKLTNTITVNQSIAELYNRDYGIEMNVLRNVPRIAKNVEPKSREELGLPENEKIIILQGSGINIDRGAEEAVEAMKFLSDTILLIIGSGDVIPQLKQKVQLEGLARKVLFKGRMPYAEMMQHTMVANLGLTLDKDTNINYRFSLPNKLFDYIHAGVPVLASDLKEVKAIVQSFKVGDVVSSVEPELIAEKIKEMLGSAKLPEWKSNCIYAREELNWNTESEVLKNVITNIDG